MKQDFNKGIILTSLGSFWWGFIGVLYFQYIFLNKSPFLAIIASPDLVELSNVEVP